jgi:predicted nucleic acid-binding protein
MRMYAIDSIVLIYALDHDDDTEPKRWAMVFATVPDERETNYVSPVSTTFQPDI